MRKILSKTEIEATQHPYIDRLRVFASLLKFQPSGEGSFKRVYPISFCDDNTSFFSEGNPSSSAFAVAVMKEKNESVIEMLKHEIKLLEILRKAGLSVPLVYKADADDGIFFIDGHAAMLVQWIPHLGMIEAKSPGITELRFRAIIRGVTVPDYEALGGLVKALEKSKLLSPNIRILENLISDLKKIAAFKLSIVDLQILIKPDGHCCIIDPLDVSIRGYERNPDLFNSNQLSRSWLKAAIRFLETEYTKIKGVTTKVEQIS